MNSVLTGSLIVFACVVLANAAAPVPEDTVIPDRPIAGKNPRWNVEDWVERKGEWFTDFLDGLRSAAVAKAFFIVVVVIIIGIAFNQWVVAWAQQYGYCLCCGLSAIVNDESEQDSPGMSSRLRPGKRIDVAEIKNKWKGKLSEIKVVSGL